jgi:putative transposase
MLRRAYAAFGHGHCYDIRRARQGGSVAQRKAMIDKSHDLPVARQAEMLGISRGRVYYPPRPTPPADLALMLRIDELHLDYPFAGTRVLQPLLKREGFEVGRLHFKALMRKMGIEAIYRRPNTSKPERGQKIFPQSPAKVQVTVPRQVWAMETTCVPMARRFVNLAAVVDWFSRRVLAWPVSISMDTSFCIEAVEGELALHGKPAIFNTDQRSLFTSIAFSDVLKQAEIAISLDGCGARRDNVFVERLWRTIKFEEVYLSAYGSTSEALSSIGRCLAFYNAGRPHGYLDRQTPDEAYFNRLEPVPAAAHPRENSICPNPGTHSEKPRYHYLYVGTPVPSADAAQRLTIALSWASEVWSLYLADAGRT